VRLPIVVVAGATATGKTAVAEILAARLDGEVVCADSRQVFRALEVGTGKPSPAERAARPHHLFEALALGERPSAGWYARAAAAAVEAIRARGRTPVLVGGTGLWLRAAMRGLAPAPAGDPAVRARLAAEAAAEGPEALHRRLAARDPATAARLRPRDAQRVMRALEVLESTGRPLSWWHRRPPEGAVAGPWRVAELRVAPRALLVRIEARARWMFAHGLLDEAGAIAAAGLAPALRALSAVGYDEALDAVEGRLSVEDAVVRTVLRTRQLAKRQRTWFRHQLEAARIEAGDDGPEALAGRVLAALGLARDAER